MIRHRHAARQTISKRLPAAAPALTGQQRSLAEMKRRTQRCSGAGVRIRRTSAPSHARGCGCAAPRDGRGAGCGTCPCRPGRRGLWLGANAARGESGAKVRRNSVESQTEDPSHEKCSRIGWMQRRKSERQSPFSVALAVLVPVTAPVAASAPAAKLEERESERTKAASQPLRLRSYTSVLACVLAWS